MNKITQDIASYYNNKEIQHKYVQCYWYGGEPTELGVDYFQSAVDVISRNLDSNDGYNVSHNVLSSMIKPNEEWDETFKRHCTQTLQTSYDGNMRGIKYVGKWEKNVRRYVEMGFRIASISVVNNDLFHDGARETLDYLSDIGIAEASFLPFMLNQENSTGAYEKYAPNMKFYSDFMIELTDRYIERKRQGLHVPEIGQISFILAQAKNHSLSNIAGQTLFLMPNGDLSLPDYHDGYLEYLLPFGNALNDNFSTILRSPARRKYLRKQATRNMNPECLSCEHSNKCIMEFWKPNRENDECFGAKRFVDYVIYRYKDKSIIPNNVVLR